MYPNIIMLRDIYASVYSLYAQNAIIPLNYVLDQEHLVDCWSEGFNEYAMRDSLESVLPEVTIHLRPDQESVPQGGVLSFDFRITNWETSSKSFYAISTAEAPQGRTATMIGPLSLTLSGNDHIKSSLQHEIPADAPLGIYTYTGTIATWPPLEIMDTEIFTFEVTAP